MEQQSEQENDRPPKGVNIKPRAFWTASFIASKFVLGSLAGLIGSGTIAWMLFTELVHPDPTYTRTLFIKIHACVGGSLGGTVLILPSVKLRHALLALLLSVVLALRILFGLIDMTFGALIWFLPVTAFALFPVAITGYAMNRALLARKDTP